MNGSVLAGLPPEQLMLSLLHKEEGTSPGGARTGQWGKSLTGASVYKSSSLNSDGNPCRL